MIKFKKTICLILILIIINLGLAEEECSTELPEIIENNIILCKQEFNIDYGVEVKSNVNLDCGGASLIGTKENTAFLLRQTENSEIKNCNLVNFQSGFYLDNANNNIIKDNKILDSKENSIYIINSNNNQIYNNQINTPLSYDEFSENIFCVELKQNEYLNIIGPGCEKPKKIDNSLTGNQLDMILSKISETRGLEKRELVGEFTRTLGKIDIEKTFQEKKVTIKIKSNKESSFVVYEYIPKETLNSTDLIQTDAKIIEKDPLMMWEFANTKTIEIQYELPKVVKEPKTIVIETIKQKVEDLSIEEEKPDLKVVAYEEEDEEEEEKTPEIIEPDKPIESEEDSNLNTILTFIVLTIIVVITVYLIKKKW